MKTYYIFLGLFMGMLLSCSTSDEANNQGDSIAISDYAVVLQQGNNLTVQLLNASSDDINLNSAQSIFSENRLPNLKYVEGVNLLQFFTSDNCSGILKRHDFKNDISKEITVFEDLNDCDLVVTSIIEAANSIFVSYVLNSEDPIAYRVRAIDKSSSNASFVDITLDKRPVDLAISGDRLYVLTIDEQITDENSLSVLDVNTKNTIDELGLGYDAQRIFKNTNGDLIIGYEELHGVVNNTSLTISYVQYMDGFTPKFAFSNSRNFGGQGKLYYTANLESNSVYPLVASSYDFANNQETIYTFEALLTEQQRNEYQIKTSAAVNFDTENNMVLIGYEKTDGVNGGLLRLQLNGANEVSQIDHIDLDGIPAEIIIR